jgi:hypothetical protein
MTTDIAQARRELAEAIAESAGTDEDEPAYYGRVIIEWPAQHRKGHVLASHGCAIFDAETGKPIPAVSRAAITADVTGFITCDLTLLADEDGKPVLDRTPQFIANRDGEIRTGVFPFLVAEMRVRT